MTLTRKQFKLSLLPKVEEVTPVNFNKGIWKRGDVSRLLERRRIMNLP